MSTTAPLTGGISMAGGRSLSKLPSRGLPGAGTAQAFWSQHREAALNWIALGMLLAAWNASDNDTSRVRRPEAFRGYASVSLRAAQRAATPMP
ncbi:MAG TPA: hypothetical protein VHV81_01035 [Steroidobacteraceae bacterium]|jgi:hypothetical protein|nr:hypothetical protein [Steroidobacteraceae bacterium]